MKRLITAAAVTVLAVSSLNLAACGRKTGSGAEGSKVGAAMPDTTQPRDPNAAMTVPDAGATGAVPADGSPTPRAETPADQPATAPATPPVTEAPK
ncbi:hypothetical protein [Phenylobacterium sp.]|uniref:hypothetical protein n=1 Tax=Phenylobacterium sp. TaxID=1871053 RepID=UPI0025CE349E|nr:hypothetical protein [Phenylobacterium sp.]